MNMKRKEKEQINKPKKGKRKNYEIMFTTYLVVAGFLGMIGYICYFVYTNETSLMNNSYNGRQELLLAQNERGTIYTSDRKVLAVNEPADDGTTIRSYPFNNMFSHVVGFSTKGKTGIESLANYYLINSSIPLSDKAENDLANKKNPGDNVYTTLNSKLQDIAYTAMGVYSGSVIVTEVKTGKVLAMVSKPDYDPNNIVNIWNELVVDDGSSELLNRSTQGIYPPGSTFKIITALEYMRENPDTYKNYAYQCNGNFSFGTSSISCYHGANHGNVSLMSAFAKSCNASFANMGVTLNRTSLSNTLKQLQFNQELPVAFNYTKSALEVNNNTTDDEIIQLSIGQGTTQMTPLHLNMITAAIGNGGVSMTPYLLDKVVSAKGSIVKSFSPSVNKTYMTKEEASVLKSLMEDVVQEGTGTKLKGLSYTAAGKTGSAEFNNVKEDSHAWFTGFAPVDNPEIAVTIIIEGIGSGGDYAVPMAKRIFDGYFE